MAEADGNESDREEVTGCPLVRRGNASGGVPFAPLAAARVAHSLPRRPARSSIREPGAARGTQCHASPRARALRLHDNITIGSLEGTRPTQSGSHVTRVSSLIILLILFSWSSVSPSETIQGERIKTSESDGVLFISETITDKDGAQIGRDEAIEFEHRLEEYLKSHSLHDVRIKHELRRYKRQYWVTVIDGRKRMLVWFYHDSAEVVQDGRWLLGMVSVAGGGNNFYRALYDLEQKEIIRINPNGPK